MCIFIQIGVHHVSQQLQKLTQDQLLIQVHTSLGLTGKATIGFFETLKQCWSEHSVLQEMFNSNTINVKKNPNNNKGKEDYCNKYKGMYPLVTDEKAFSVKLDLLDTFAVLVVPATRM